MEFDRNGLVVLDRSECLHRLGQCGVGRVAFTSDALPTIMPVNYAMLDEDIVFRSSRGSKFDAAMRHSVVAFEVDDVDWFGHGGWSVLAIGPAGPLSEPSDRARVARLPLAHWVSGDVELVRIHTDLLSGRLLSPVLADDRKESV